MDPLSDVISLLEPKTYRVGGFDAGGQWSICFGGNLGLKCYAVIAGESWLTVEGDAEPTLLTEGDCFLLPHGRAFCLASDPALPAEDWRVFFSGPTKDAVTLINGGGGTTVIGGQFQFDGPHTELLLSALPPVVLLRSDADRETLLWAFERLGKELVELKPGNALIAQQLSYMILIQALRLYVNASANTGWLSALSDKHIGAAIGLIHRDPARRWTVGSLAVEVAMSRSNFAERFRRHVGEGPIEYLTRWRMLLAGRSLRRGQPVGIVAQSLGYRSESAFSTAFKRVMGSSPLRHARLGRADDLT